MNNENIERLLFSHRIAQIASGWDVDLPSLQARASKLNPELPHPSACDFFIPPPLMAKPALFRPTPGVPIYPESVFAALPELDELSLPRGWVQAHRCWKEKVARGRAFQEAQLSASRESSAEVEAQAVTLLPAVAGALLFYINPAPDSAVRHVLMKSALRAPSGAYFAAEGLTLQEERPALVEAVKRDSRLLYWVSRIAGFETLCATPVMAHFDFWAGLSLASSGVADSHVRAWYRDLRLAALEEPAAASAALILLSEVDSKTRQMWASVLERHQARRLAYEAARWGSFEAEDELAFTRLRKLAVGDGGRFAALWHRDVEPPCAQEAIDLDVCADSLWAAELIDWLGLEDSRLRARLGNMSGSVEPTGAQLVLRYLDAYRNKRRGA